MNAPNVGKAAPPERQGYDRIPEADPSAGPEVEVYGCPECGAVWNADDLHASDCPRLFDREAAS